MAQDITLEVARYMAIAYLLAVLMIVIAMLCTGAQKNGKSK